MPNTFHQNKHSTRARRAAALALSAFLLSGAAARADLFVSHDQYTNGSGGAVLYTAGDINSTDFEEVNIYSNSAECTPFVHGGAIYATPGSVTLGATVISFDANTVTGPTARGGAVYAWSNIVLSADDISLTNNAASGSEKAEGGAIYSKEGGVKVGSDATESVRLSNNIASYGGAIMANTSADIRGRTIEIRNNQASGSNTAYGGAINAGTSVCISGDVIEIRGNQASGGEISYGGAIFVTNGGATLNAPNGTITFDGNRAVSLFSTFTNHAGGAIWADGDIALTARDIFVNSATDTFWSEHGSITIDGNLTAAPGASFIAKYYPVTVKNGVLTLTGVPHSDDVTADQLTTFASGAGYDLTGMTLALTNPRAGTYDVAVVVGAEVKRPALRNNKRFKWQQIQQIAPVGELAKMLSERVNDGFGAETKKAYKLILTVNSLPLVWCGNDGDVWQTGSDAFDAWVISTDTTTNEVFYDGDTVTFDTYGVISVTVSGDVAPAGLLVTGGTHTFGGSGAISADSIVITGGTASFARPLTVRTASFDMSGGTLQAVSGDSSVISGGGFGELNVSGGSLFIAGSENAHSGDVYTVARDFAAINSLWAPASVDSEATLNHAAYAVTSADEPSQSGGGSKNAVVTIYGADAATIVWNGDEGGLWCTGATDKKWTISDDAFAAVGVNGAPTDFYNSDRVIFTAGGGKNVSVDALIWPASMTVTGSHTFDLNGSAIYVSDDLSVSGAQTEAAFIDTTGSDRGGLMLGSLDVAGGAVSFDVPTLLVGITQRVNEQQTRVEFVPTGGTATIRGGTVEFAGDMTIISSLDVSGGTAVFAGNAGDFSFDPLHSLPPVTGTGAASLSDGAIVLSGDQPLYVLGRFAQSGGTLSVNGALVSGDGNALLRGVEAPPEGETFNEMPWALFGASLGEAGHSSLDVTGGRLVIEGAAGVKAGDTFHIADGFAAITSLWAPGSIDIVADLPRLTAVATSSGYEDGGVTLHKADVTVYGGNAQIVWNGESGDLWRTGATDGKWTISDDVFAGGGASGTKTDFYDLDAVIFDDSTSGTVVVSGEVAPDTVELNGGTHRFAGATENSQLWASSRLLVSGDAVADFVTLVRPLNLIVGGSASAIVRELDKNFVAQIDGGSLTVLGQARFGQNVHLNGGELIVSGDGSLVTNDPGQLGTFFMQSGGKLVIDGLASKTSAPFQNGQGTWHINVSGGSLYIANNSGDASGSTYYVANSTS
ncbi:MAG: hypothetical protein J6Z30_08875, partial [Pyramidobacter sp.]|nr:hypothetical protein [Pyramidobacter sp.]